MKWEEHTDILQVYADAGNTQGNVTDTTIFTIIPPCTLVDDYVQRFADHKEATGKNITVAEWIDCKNSTTKTKEAVKIDNILLDQCWRGIICIAIKSQIDEEKQSTSNKSGNKNTNDDNNDTAPPSTKVRAQIQSYGGKRQHIGLFDKPQDTARAHMLAKEQL